jgi:hypothetical protein
MKKTGIVLVSVVTVGVMVTAGVVLAADNGNPFTGSPQICQVAGPPGQMGNGPMRMAQTIASLANKPVEEVLKAKKPGVSWWEVAEKFGVNLDQVFEKGYTGNGFCRALNYN